MKEFKRKKKHKKKKKKKSKKKKKKHKKKMKKEDSDSTSSSEQDNDVPKEMKQIDADLSQKIINLLFGMLTAYPKSKEELQFFLFRVDRNQKVAIDGIVDKKIRNGFKSIFQLAGLEKIGSTEKKIVYRRKNTTPSLLHLFDKTMAVISQESMGKNLKQQKNKSIKKIENTKECIMKSSKALPSIDQTYIESIPNGKKQSGSTYQTKRIIGPFKPPKDMKSRNPTLDEDNESEEDTFGPKLLSKMTNIEKQAQDMLSKQREINQIKHALAKQMKSNKKREEWMLTLPPEKRTGLMGKLDSMRNRKFLTEEYKGRGDTTVWTDTPEDRHRKSIIAAIEKNAFRKEKSQKIKNKQIFDQEKNISKESDVQSAIISKIVESNEDRDYERVRLRAEFLMMRKRKRERRKMRKTSSEEIPFEWNRDKMMAFGTRHQSWTTEPTNKKFHGTELMKRFQ